MVKTDMVSNPDLDAYLGDMRARLPEAQRPTEAQMLRYGRETCRLMDGYVTGSPQTPTQLIAPLAWEDGHDPKAAFAIIDAAREAGRGVLCTYRLVPLG